MTIRLLERIYKVLRRRKQRRLHKALSMDVGFYMEAGVYFIQRSEAFYNTLKSSRSFKNARPYNTLSLPRKQLTQQQYPEKILPLPKQQQQYAETQKQKQKQEQKQMCECQLIRRNAISELSEEEREGLTLVLKGYIQQRNLKEFGML